MSINVATESHFIICVMRKRYFKKRFLKAMMIQDVISISDST